MDKQNQMNENIPDCWKLSTFEHICDYVQRGKSPKYTEKNSFPVVNQKAIRWNEIEEEHLKYVDESQWKAWDAERFIKEGDILWNSTGTGTIGRACYISREQLKKAKVVDSHVTIVRTNSLIASKYAFYWIMNSEVQTKILGLYTGSTNQVELSKAIILALKIPVAPLAEQQQIAAKLDELLAQVDSIKTRLDAIPKIMKRFRQSVLAAAVSGKLTEDWRNSKEYSETEIGLIPCSWSAKQAQQVCEKVQSGSTPRDNPFDQGGNVPFLKVYNIVKQQIDFDYKPQFVTKETHENALKRSIALPNDILMNIVGPPLGKVALLTAQYPQWNLNQAITFFRANSDLLNYKYLYFVLCEGALVRKVMPDTKGSVGQVNISLTQCREALIPTPSLEEQIEIASRVEQLFAYADQIEQRVKDAQNRVNNLSQAILAKAFRGELTADWRAQNLHLISGENSAAALLAKIQSERNASKSSKKAK